MTTKPQLLKKLNFLSPADRELLISAQRKIEAERIRRAVELRSEDNLKRIERLLRSGQ